MKGVLQRKCATCGNHTMGGQCKKKQTLQRASLSPRGPLFSSQKPGPSPTVIVFHYNPEQLSRSLAHRAAPPHPSSVGSAREDSFRVFGQPVDEGIIDEAHIIDIDRIVLTGVDPRNPARLNALIEVEVLAALRGPDLRTSTGVANSEARVAGEVARTVVRSIQGGSDSV